MTKHTRPGLLIGALLLLAGFQVLYAQTATQTFSTAGTYTFTVPIGVTSITVQAWGGGGGARGDGTSNRGGGGGGAFAGSTISPVLPGATYTVVVGAGGVATSNPGQAGQNSIFGNNLVVAEGGTGGSNTGGAGGTTAGSIGTTRFAGGTGGSRGGTTGVGGGGGGGGSALSTANGGSGADGGLVTGGAGGTGAGNGGNGGNDTQSGVAGTAPGGGGGGRGSLGATSGRGADGQVSVSYASNTVDLVVTKTANTSLTTVGQAVTFTVNVSNNGIAPATNVVATDLLPAGYTFIRATLSSSTNTYSSSTGQWTIGTLANGATVSMVLIGIVNSSGNYNNTASVTSNQTDVNTANNSATAPVTVCRAGSSTPLFN